MNVYQILSCLLGGVGAVVLTCFAILWLEKNFASENFDERQQIARYKAYRAAYYVGVVWTFVSLFYIAAGGDTDGMLVVLLMGFEVQAMTFHIYCLLTHAELPLSQKPMNSAISYGCLTVVYGVMMFYGRGIDERWPDKPPAATWMQLSLLVWHAVLCILHLIQYFRDRKEG